MRRELATIAIVAASSAPANADLRVLVAADSYLATTPGITTDDAADVAWSAHIESRDPEQDIVFDWVERESLIGGTPRRELHELSYVDRRIPGLELTVGRFRVPGGFWLIADGAGVALRSSTIVAGVFGGSRSFTNGRSETLLTSHPHPLPLAGAALTTRGAIQVAVSYTYTADRVSLYRGDGVTATRREPEQFLDAELAAAVGAHGFVTLGATIGSRYLVSYPTTDAHLTDDPTLDNVWFGSQAVYALFDERADAWRLDARVSALRTKLGQASDPALAAISGSFAEGTLRATWHRDRTWRIDARYRARLWDDHSRAQRAEISAEWRHGALDASARVGVDLHHNVATAPGKLTRAHAALESQCNRCHVPFGGIPQTQCLTCHTALAERTARGIGYHATVKAQPCTDCHKEHHGRDVALAPSGSAATAPSSCPGTPAPASTTHAMSSRPRSARCRSSESVDAIRGAPRPRQRRVRDPANAPGWQRRCKRRSDAVDHR